MDLDAHLRIFGAAVRLWMRDALRDEHELERLAHWLDLEPGELHQVLANAPRIDTRARHTAYVVLKDMVEFE